MRPIDADVIFPKSVTNFNDDCLKCKTSPDLFVTYVLYQKFWELIDSIPTLDVKPVHYCRECKWSRCWNNVDKYGNIETYWRCLNWDGGTDEEGYCYEWEARTEV